MLKPEYLFRPSQLMRRILGLVGGRAEFREVQTPWGLPMRVRPQEAIGRSLCHLGVLDLALSEVVWRLLEPGETAVDVGANIGYITGLMAVRSGPRGEVWAFEPCPEIFAELSGHVSSWAAAGYTLSLFRLHPEALSDREGSAILFQPDSFATNRGTASLEGAGGTPALPGRAGGRVEVSLQAFDALFPRNQTVGVFKIDVEGHELQALLGARQSLQEGRVRDVVFEEHHGYPSATTKLLESLGFTIWRIDRRFFGPSLLPPADSAPNSVWLPPNFLATRDPKRAWRLCQRRGWQVLAGAGTSRGNPG